MIEWNPLHRPASLSHSAGSFHKLRNNARNHFVLTFRRATARNSQMPHAPRENLADCLLQCATDIMHHRKRDFEPDQWAMS
jgi:hypothetical protein